MAVVFITGKNAELDKGAAHATAMGEERRAATGRDGDTYTALCRALRARTTRMRFALVQLTTSSPGSGSWPSDRVQIAKYRRWLGKLSGPPPMGAANQCCGFSPLS